MIDGPRARAFRWPPLRPVRLCCERESVAVVCPPVLPFQLHEEDEVRAIGLDVPRDFCKVAVVEGVKFAPPVAF